MMLEPLARLIDKDDDFIRSSYGGKALGLLQACRAGLLIPESWVIKAQVFIDFIAQDNIKLEEDWLSEAKDYLQLKLAKQIAELPDEQFAIRSSATQEDGAIHSYAGVFDSLLHVKKADFVEAIAKVWQSSCKARAQAYQSTDAVAMAVIIQPMLTARFAGVAFTRHPAPRIPSQEAEWLVELAACEGESIVQGEITPLQLVAQPEVIAKVLNTSWAVDLVQALLTLQQTLNYQIDAEFLVDQSNQFYLLQQRPISATHVTKQLSLEGYQRAFKRQLHALDIALLIEGCVNYLPDFLQINTNLCNWMIMTTATDGMQELWVNELIEQAILAELKTTIHNDKSYLIKIHSEYHNRLEQLRHYPYAEFTDQQKPLLNRWFAWLSFIKPLYAHYYLPLFIIDSLSELLLSAMSEIDPEHAEADLLKLATTGIASLADDFSKALHQLRKKLPETLPAYSELSAEIQAKLVSLVNEYGFLKCHQIDLPGYTAEEIYQMLSALESMNTTDLACSKKLKQKYITDETISLFSALQTWITIRNREMEYFLLAIDRSRGLLDEIAEQLNCQSKIIWLLAPQAITQALINETTINIEIMATANLAICWQNNSVQVSNSLHVIKPTINADNCCLTGNTVAGEGKLQAKVIKALTPQKLESLKVNEPVVLVTGMTTPDYIPYLKDKFVGLVTDEGGLLCHAAILARELNLPTIVGTGFATDCLADGQQVTLDLDLGKVFWD